jgi:hypothetical protein
LCWPGIESIDVLATIPHERTPSFELLFFHPSDPVLTACLAQLRAPSGGVWLAEQGVAPGPLCLRKQRPGRLGPPPVPIAGWGLPSMAGRGRTEGRRQCRLDRGEVRLVRSSPEERSRGEKRHKWSAGRRACLARHAAPQAPSVDLAPFGAPRPHAGEGREMRAPPAPTKQQGR